MAGFIAQATSPVAPSGELKIYSDAGCTQPITGAMILDFGQPPFKVIGAGEQVDCPRTIPVWFRNEATVSIRFISSVIGIPGGTPILEQKIVVSLPTYSQILASGAVLPWVLKAALKGPLDGTISKAVVDIQGEYITG